ncbi:stalk domain-containing protein [Paenibacillus antri]|nr:stalk domain-containing protein [Paenibacillus antri]
MENCSGFIRGWGKRAAMAALAAALLPLGAAAEAGTKDAGTDGYTRIWSYSSGNREFDPTLSVVEAGGDGTALYAKRNLYDGGVLEFGKIGPTGKTIWKRDDLAIYEFSLTDGWIVASIHTAGADYRKETIVRIDKKDGGVKSKFLLESIGIERMEKFTADRDRIYIAGGNRLVAVTYDGKVVWEKTWDDYPGADIPMTYETPVLASGDMLLAWTTCSMSQVCGFLEETDYRLSALSPSTGETLWSAAQQVSSSRIEPPAPDAKQIVLENGFEGKMFAYRLADGKKLWEYAVDDEVAWASLDPGIVDPDGRSYVNVIGSGEDGYATERIVALNADGTVAWDIPWNNGSIMNLIGIRPDGSALYWESSEEAIPSVYTVDRRTGKTLAVESYRRPGGAARPLADANDGLFAYPTAAGSVTKDQWFASGEERYFADWRHKAALATRNGAIVGRLTYRGDVNLEVGPDQTAYLSDARTIAAYASTRETASVAVNGRYPPLPRPATVRGGYTYVPVRGVLEQAGASVAWDGVERKVTIAKPGKTVELRIDGAQAIVNGAPAPLEAPAIMDGGSAMLPLRFLVETLDGTVTWDAETRTAWIETP